MNLEQYKSDPCGSSSLPYHKALLFDTSHVVYATEKPSNGTAYFRLIHHLETLEVASLPEGYELRPFDAADDALKRRLVNFINSCYENISIKSSQVEEMCCSKRFDSALWLIVETPCGAIAAAGISEVDFHVPEGMLEWIQVGAKHRGRGLGRYIVCETLKRLRNQVDFVTVSGECDNVTSPERLYRVCGFTGKALWVIP